MDKTLDKENNDDEQREKRRINAIHFLNGLSYAMDRCFQRLYASSYKGNGIRCSVRGYFIFVVWPESIQPRYTLLQRRYVGNLNQEKYQEQNPFYVARVSSVETVDAWASNLPYYFDDEKDVKTPIRPLVLSAVNTQNFPNERDPIAITEHRAKDFFKEAKKGEYAYALLDQYAIFPNRKSVQWSDQAFDFMHVNQPIVLEDESSVTAAKSDNHADQRQEDQRLISEGNDDDKEDEEDDIANEDDQ